MPGAPYLRRCDAVHDRPHPAVQHANRVVASSGTPTSRDAHLHHKGWNVAAELLEQTLALPT